MDHIVFCIDFSGFVTSLVRRDLLVELAAVFVDVALEVAVLATASPLKGTFFSYKAKQIPRYSVSNTKQHRNGAINK